MVRHPLFSQAAIVVGCVLVVNGWFVDFYSSGDPHVLDTTRFAILAVGVATILYRKWRSVRRPHTSATDVMT